MDSRDIAPRRLEERPLDDASYYGRVFARTGGLAEAVARALKEQGSDFELKAVSCDGDRAVQGRFDEGIKECAWRQFYRRHGMHGGCIGGAGCLTHGVRNRSDIDRYAKQAGDNGYIRSDKAGRQSRGLIKDTRCAA